MINKDILNYICCPKCKAEFKRVSNFLICMHCQKRYEIVEDIPVLTNLKGLEGHYQEQILYFEKEIKNSSFCSLEEWQKSYLRRFDRCISLSKRNVIADIGTGSGYMAIELAKRGNIVLACDLNLRGLIKLKKISEKLNLDKNLFLFACSAEELPIKSSLVDVFILNAVLEHLPKEELAIKEINRICKSKAYGFVSVPLCLKYIWPFFWPINIVHDKKIGHLRRYDEKDLKKKFATYGFKIKRIFYTGHFLKVLGVLTQIIIKSHKFDKFLENVDRKKENKKYGASNVVIIIKRDKNIEVEEN